MTDVGVRAGATTGTRLTALDSALRAGTLGTVEVFCSAMSAATPMTVIAGVVTTGFATTGLLGLPVAFVAVAVVLAVFAPGYVAMSRHIGNAGAFYAYISRGVGRPFGVAGAGVALVAYNALQVSLYGAIGLAVQPLVATGFGIDVPWWLGAGVAWLVVATLGLMRITISGRLITALLLAEVLVILVFSVASVANPAGGVVNTVALEPGNLIGPGVGAILVLALLGFVGFEAPAIYSEEARDPNRTVARATYLTLALTCVTYAFGSWALTVASGAGNVISDARTQGEDLLFNQANAHLGEVLTTIGRVLFITSLLAALMSQHNNTARYTFALGREGVLPKVLGRTRARTGAPIAGSLLQSAVGAAVLVIYTVAGWDPLVDLFFWFSTVGGVGVLALVAATSISVVSYFLRRPSTERLWARLIAPALAAVALLLILTLAVLNMPTVLGVPPGDPSATAIPLAHLAAALLGFGWGLVLRARRPAAYRAIGYGAKAPAESGVDLG